VIAAPVLSAVYAGRTWTVGEVLYVHNAAITDGGYEECQAVRVASIDRWGVPEFAVAGDHVNHRGRVIVATGSTYWQDTHAPGFSGDNSEAQDAEVAESFSGPPPAALVRATRITRKIVRKGDLPREYAITKGAVVHVATAAGTPLCGSKVSAWASNPDRWNPWQGHTVEADERESVYLPSFQSPTCAKCAARQAGARVTP